MNHSTKNTFRLALLGAAVSVVALLASCASPTDAESSGGEAAEIPTQAVNEELAAQLPVEIADRGSILVHTTVDYPPNNFADDAGKPTGFTIDLGNSIGELLGVEMDWQISTFDALIPGIEAKRFDISMASYAPTNERMKVVDFATTIIGAAAIGVKAGAGENYPDRESLCGTKLGVNAGTYYVGLAEELSGDCVATGEKPVDVNQFPSAKDAMTALNSGRIDAILDSAGALLYASSQQSTQFEVIGEQFWPEAYSPEGVVVPKGSVLGPLFADAINELIDNGTYQAILDKWGLAAVGIERSEVNPEVEV